MAAVLYVAGVLALLAGLVAIGFGSPASALDFGNTLIEAGATAAAGGLITIALAATVGRLQRIVDLLVAPMPHDYVEHPGAQAAQPAKPEPKVAPAAPPASSVIPTPGAPFEPRGPSTPPEFPPSGPVPRVEPPAPRLQPTEAREPEPAPPQPEPDVHQAEPPAEAPEPLPRQPDLPPKSFFESVWPEEKALEPSMEPEPRPAAPAEPLPASPEQPAKSEKPRAMAILKSGVVDGMGYTLYVDGSIEAELPQGTVRFASIHELRAHLEKNSG